LPVPSTMRAPAGTRTDARGPTAAMRLPRTTIVASLTTAPPVPSMSVAPTMAISVSGATLARPVRCVCAPIEALAILAVLVLNAGLGVLQEYRSESALDELERLGTPHVWVIRDGALSRIEATELVPGDRVRVEAGDRIAADGKAEVSESLCTDESLLTGESQSVEKNDGDELMSGTLVVRGRAELVVTRTGAASTMGKLAGALERIEAGKTPLEVRIDVLGARLARYVAALALLFMGLGIAVDGLAHFPTIVMFAVAFGVAVVPESMPMMMTLALAFGVQRMGRRNAVVRRLSAVEALGSITVIA